MDEKLTTGIESPFLDGELLDGWAPDRQTTARTFWYERESPFVTTSAPWREEGHADEAGPDAAAGEASPADAALTPLPEHENGPTTTSKAVSDALARKAWRTAVRQAVSDGVHDYNTLTNLVFFAQHTGLGGRRLDPKDPTDAKLITAWNTIRRSEIWPAVQEASASTALRVSGRFVAERDLEFLDATGRRFKEWVEQAANEVDLNPGLLAAVCLAEAGRQSYVASGGISSFVTGTDDFFAQRHALRANVPAFTRVRFRLIGTDVNEHLRTVNTVEYTSGRDAVLATAVYLKYGEIKLRRAAAASGQDFDAFAVETRFALVRVAMTAGHGGITGTGTMVRFKRVAGKVVRVKPGEAGGSLIGVATRLDRVLKGEDFLVRVDEPRRDPTNDARVTNRNATILVAQAMHLADWIFGRPVTSVPPAQPEIDNDTELEALDMPEEQLDAEDLDEESASGPDGMHMAESPPDEGAPSPVPVHVAAPGTSGG